MDQLYLSLAETAIRLVRVKSGWLDAVWNWEYTLPDYFFRTERVGLAIRIAEKILETATGNSHYAVKLAQLKRESGDATGAIRVLQAASPPNNHRAFWVEWGVACGKSDDYLSNAALNAYAISDIPGASPPTLENGTVALAGLAKAFDELHAAQGHAELHRARAACAMLGLLTDAHHKVLNEHQHDCTSAGTPKDVAEGISWLHRGLASALTNTCLDKSISEKIGNPAQFNFSGLQTLLERSR